MAILDKLKAQKTPPTSLPNFLGTPTQGKEVLRQRCVESGFYCGLPNLLPGSEFKQSADYAGILVTGQASPAEGEKRALHESECWIVFRAAPSRPGDSGPTYSTLTVLMKQGQYSALSHVVDALLGWLRDEHWLDESRQ